MKNDNRSYDTIGSGTTALQINFLVLKLCNLINWSWWWVLSPLWISFAIWLIAVIVVVIIKYRATKRLKNAVLRLGSEEK